MASFLASTQKEQASRGVSARYFWGAKMGVTPCAWVCAETETSFAPQKMLAFFGRWEPLHREIIPVILRLFLKAESGLPAGFFQFPSLALSHKRREKISIYTSVGWGDGPYGQWNIDIFISGTALTKRKFGFKKGPSFKESKLC